MLKPSAIFHGGTKALAKASVTFMKPLSGRRLLPLWGVVHYRGRKSGREMSTTVQVRGTSDTFLIALPWGAGTQWVRNVQAAGGCILTWRGTDYRAESPEILGIDDATAFRGWERALLRLVKINQFLRLRRVSASGGTRPAAA